jgi:hypothetical protein
VIGTSQEEIRHYREQAELQKYGEIKDRTWQKGPLLVLFLALIVLYFLWDELRYR